MICTTSAVKPIIIEKTNVKELRMDPPDSKNLFTCLRQGAKCFRNNARRIELAVFDIRIGPDSF